MDKVLAAMPRYEKYRDSGVEWLGEIPEFWETKKLKHVLQFQTGGTPSSGVTGYYDGNIPWVTIGDMKGREINRWHCISKRGLIAASIPKTKTGSLLFSFKLSVGQVAFSKQDLYTNEAIASFSPSGGVCLEFWFYALSGFVKKNAATNIYGALILNQTLINDALLLTPPLIEQQMIAAYLDAKTTQIDQAIQLKEKQIALLKERRQILIQNAVTRGLDPDAPTKNSGVEWIGEIPAHWAVKRAKYLFTEVDERSVDGQEELLSVSHMTGVTPRSEKNVSMFMAEDYTGSKTCQKDDLVFNIMWAWMGALGVSGSAGIVSSSYGIFRQKTVGLFNAQYLEYLLKTTKYIEHYNRVSTGLHSSRLRFYGHMFFDMELGFPDRDEQEKIIEYVNRAATQINQAITLQQQQIHHLKEYRATLINSAVTGKIKVV